jgi:hypothetical protein
MPEKPKQGDPNWYGEQDENGVDLSLIRRLLTLTPTERVRLGEEARASTLRLMEIGRRHREEQARKPG